MTTAAILLLIGLLALLLLWLGSRLSSFESFYRQQTQACLETLPPPGDLLTAADLQALPPLLQVYLERCGAIGKPRVRGFRARFRGRFRNGLRGPWMPFTSEQHNFIEPSARLFLMRAALFGLPLQGYHDFIGNAARFRIRLLSLLQVVDGQGPTFNQSETVTLFNDFCVLAPAALVDLPIQWTTVTPHSLRGVFSRGEQTVSALLTFDEAGDLVNFSSPDRYFSSDGKTTERWPWFTPMGQHRDFGNIRLPAYGEATWETPDGDFVYGEFHLQEIEYL
jgi:hypothetical protein